VSDPAVEHLTLAAVCSPSSAASAMDTVALQSGLGKRLARHVLLRAGAKPWKGDREDQAECGCWPCHLNACCVSLSLTLSPDSA
jgi:hypothetical protein